MVHPVAGGASAIMSILYAGRIFKIIVLLRALEKC